MQSLTTARVPARRSDSREATRARLLAVARLAFARKGLAGVSLTEDVLRPAAVSVGSFYHQFSDKTDLFLTILRRHTETFRDMIREAHDPRSGRSPLEMARHSYRTVFKVAEENGDLFRILVRERESDNRRVRTYLQEAHRDWIRSLAEDYRRLGLAPSREVDAAELAAELISALTVGTVLRYLELPVRERPTQRERLIEGLVQFTLGGVPQLMAGRCGPPSGGTAATHVRKRERPMRRA
jgi:AcrR family transcriptional regulator